MLRLFKNIEFQVKMRLKKYVGLPLPGGVYKKRASQKMFSMLIYYPSYAYPGKQSRLLALSSASYFSCSCCFDVLTHCPRCRFHYTAV